MNQEDPARLLRHVMLCMPRGIWHAIDAAAEFAPSLLQISGLHAFQVETLLLSKTVLQRYGEEMRYNLLSLENLGATFPATMPLHIQRHRLVQGGPNSFFSSLANQTTTAHQELNLNRPIVVFVLDAAISYHHQPF